MSVLKCVISTGTMKFLLIIPLLMAAAVSASPQQKNDDSKEVYYTNWETHFNYQPNN